MKPGQKIEIFELLLDMGFQDIEIGFPSASADDLCFTRTLAESERVPDGVRCQVLVPARRELIERTFDAISGLRNVIVHLYNSTSRAQRRVVFRKTESEIIKMAVDATEDISRLAADCDAEVVLQYSPESFTGTELAFSRQICEAVHSTWRNRHGGEVIFNIPSTVELATPNVYADQVEWFKRNMPKDENLTLSVHTHNDRGSGVAAAELALLAGADRVEGTLLGYGERTGNVDLVTLALNMASHGTAPGLDLSDLPNICEVIERCTGERVHPRHPYAGDLVFTAFSGSHQDAVSKGMRDYFSSDDDYWEVPYLSIDPKDIGRHYESLIRVNSQSGKGGIGFLLESISGIALPREMLVDFSSVVQKVADRSQGELSPERILALFNEEYRSERGALQIEGYRVTDAQFLYKVIYFGRRLDVIFPKSSCGLLEAFLLGLRQVFPRLCGLNIENYSEKALAAGMNADAVAFIEVSDGGVRKWGCGVDSDTACAELRALLSAINRLSIDWTEIDVIAGEP